MKEQYVGTMQIKAIKLLFDWRYVFLPLRYIVLCATFIQLSHSRGQVRWLKNIYAAQKLFLILPCKHCVTVSEVTQLFYG